MSCCAIRRQGSIPSIAEEYRSIAGMGQAEELDRQIAREYPQKGKVMEKHHMEWVLDIDYHGYKLPLLSLGIEKDGKKGNKDIPMAEDLEVTGKNAAEFARTGRGR